MADLDQKVAENVPGRNSAHNTRISSDLGRAGGGYNCGGQDADGYSYVRAQPSSPDEEVACRAALDECPVEAIGMTPLD